MKFSRPICVVTGARSEYGILKPVLRAIQSHPKLKLQIAVAGMHWVRSRGETWREIRKDKFPIDAKILMEPSHNRSTRMAEAVGLGILGYVKAFSRLKPACVLVLGDRTEMLAAAIAAVYMNIPLAHIHGGDITQGGFDESARHAITKLAHLHFPATPKSAECIQRMGEEPWRIFRVGSPAIDMMKSADIPNKDQLSTYLGMPVPERYILFVQHPLSTMPQAAAKDFDCTVAALKTTKLPIVALFPNTDLGAEEIAKRLRSLRKDPQFKVITNLPRVFYLALLRSAVVLVGNSSSGIIDAPYFKVPVVDIGNRQKGREAAANVLHAPGNTNQISRAIHKALSDPFRQYVRKNGSNLYGDGRSGPRIARILARIQWGPRWMQKQLHFP